MLPISRGPLRQTPLVLLELPCALSDLLVYVLDGVPQPVEMLRIRESGSVRVSGVRRAIADVSIQANPAGVADRIPVEPPAARLVVVAERAGDKTALLVGVIAGLRLITERVGVRPAIERL